MPDTSRYYLNVSGAAGVMHMEINGLLTPSQLDEINGLLSDAPWVDGTGSAGDHARAVKQNLELDQSSESWSRINDIVLSELYRNPSFQTTVLPSRVSAAYVVSYREGGAYGVHVDDPIMGDQSGRYRSDVAVTVFLNSPDDYDGGELTVRQRGASHSVKLEAGSAIAYPAARQHEVTPVTRGERRVCVLWVQSLVRNADKREILADLDDARRALRQATPNARVTGTIDGVYTRLMQRWADP